MEQPQAFAGEDYQQIGETLQPVYSVFKGITVRQMSSLIRQAMDQIAIRDPLPEEVRARFGLVPLQTAVHDIHFPPDEVQLGHARDRLVFDEFFRFILAIRKQKEKNSRTVQKQPRKAPGFASVFTYRLTKESLG